LLLSLLWLTLPCGRGLPVPRPQSRHWPAGPEANALPAVIREPLVFWATHVDGLGLFQVEHWTIHVTLIEAVQAQYWHLLWARRVVRLDS